MKRSRCRRRGEIRGIITRMDQFRVKGPGWWRLLRFVVIRVSFLLALFYSCRLSHTKWTKQLRLRATSVFSSSHSLQLTWIPAEIEWRISLNETMFYIGDNLVLGLCSGPYVTYRTARPLVSPSRDKLLRFQPGLASSRSWISGSVHTWTFGRRRIWSGSAAGPQQASMIVAILAAGYEVSATPAKVGPISFTSLKEGSWRSIL
ncbi:hypothetical protein EDD85DRAFT_390709 [Armillaria nabsnona]|nr:hypothetical protein EDD85DRAFT_390709 [Armillaria nabsnona]